MLSVCLLLKPTEQTDWRSETEKSQDNGTHFMGLEAYEI